MVRWALDRTLALSGGERYMPTMPASSRELRVRSVTDGYALVGEHAAVETINAFLSYLSDRNYSRQRPRVRV